MSSKCQSSSFRGIIVIASALCLWLTLGTLNFLVGVHFTSDAVAYHQCAQSILERRGFLIFDYSWENADKWVPMRLWPPGQSIAIAALGTFGIPLPRAAQAVNFFGFTVGFVIVLWILFRFCPRTLAATFAVAAACTYSVSRYATFGLSEGGYVAFSLASLVLLVVGEQATAKRSYGLLFLTGSLVGCAILFRYVGLSLLAGEGLYLLVRSVKTRNIYKLCAFAAGTLLTGGWFFLYNVWTFSQIVPYQMPPSSVGIGENLYHLGLAMSSVFLPLRYSAFNYWPALVLFASGAYVLFLLMLRPKECHPLDCQAGRESGLIHLAWLMALYVIVYFTQVVAARARYEWGEIINTRHVVPVAWPMMIVMSALLAHLMRNCSKSRFLLAFLSSALTLWALQLALHSARALVPLRQVGQEIEIIRCAQAISQEPAVKGTVLADGPSRIYLTLFGNVTAKYAPRLSRREHPVDWQEVATAIQSRRISAIVVSTLAREDVLTGNYGPVFQEILERRVPDARWQLKDYGYFRLCTLRSK